MEMCLLKRNGAVLGRKKEECLLKSNTNVFVFVAKQYKSFFLSLSVSLSVCLSE